MKAVFYTTDLKMPNRNPHTAPQKNLKKYPLLFCRNPTTITMPNVNRIDLLLPML